MIFKYLTPLALRVITGVALAIAIVYAGLQWDAARKAKWEARLSDAQGQAASQSGADAVGTVGAVAGRSSDTEQITRENSDAIHNAPGADAPVDHRATGAGLDSLCRRAAYRGSEQCLQRATP